MKKFSKILCAVLVLVMVLSLCACGGSSKSMTSQKGKLIMGTNASFPPYEFISDTEAGKIVGIDAEIAEAIAKKLGLELVIEDMEFASIITSVQSGKIDMGMAGMTVTDERKQNVNFSQTYATGVQSIIVPEGSPITSVDDLYADGASYTIGVQESTTGHIYSEDDFGAENVIAYSNGAVAVEALKAGTVDCVIIDNQPALNYVEANTGLVILDTSYAVEDYAIAVKKDNADLLSAIDKALEELIKDGTVQAIIDKYIVA